MSPSARIWIAVALLSGLILIFNRDWLTGAVLRHQVTIVDRFLVHFIAAPIIAAAAAAAAAAMWKLRERRRNA